MACQLIWGYFMPRGLKDKENQPIISLDQKLAKENVMDLIANEINDIML